MKLFIVTLLAAGTVALSSETAMARHAGGRGDTQDYAIEYCRYYKTKAMFAGRKARTNSGVRKYAHRANDLWAKYNACLKNNGWPVAYRAPVY